MADAGELALNRAALAPHALLERLVEAHHGTIAVSSDQGRGTKFLVVLPLLNESQI